MTETATPPNRLWWYVGLAAVIAWAAYLMVGLPSTVGRKVGEPADYDWSLLDLDGRPVPFSQYKGKVVFLNVWATWCPPCVREMPSIARLAANPRLKKVAFVCASVDNSPEVVKRFLSEKGWTMTFLRATDLPPSFATQSIPATYVISPDGKVVASEIGSKEWDSAEDAEMLEKLANTAP